MTEEEARTDGHGTETLGWIAIERGKGVTTDNRRVTVFNDSASSQAGFVPFGQNFRRVFPVIAAEVITSNEPDPVFPRYRNLTSRSMQLFLREEESFDSETTHPSETVSVFVAE